MAWAGMPKWWILNQLRLLRGIGENCHIYKCLKEPNNSHYSGWMWLVRTQQWVWATKCSDMDSLFREKSERWRWDLQKDRNCKQPALGGYTNNTVWLYIDLWWLPCMKDPSPWCKTRPLPCTALFCSYGEPDTEDSWLLPQREGKPETMLSHLMSAKRSQQNSNLR